MFQLFMSKGSVVFLARFFQRSAFPLIVLKVSKNGASFRGFLWRQPVYFIQKYVLMLIRFTLTLPL